MTKDNVLLSINGEVDIMVRFIREILFRRDDVNREVLDRYIKVLSDFQTDQKIDTLLKFREIYHRPSLEGEDTDYTESTSLQLDGKYLSLADKFEEIENLVSKYYELSASPS